MFTLQSLTMLLTKCQKNHKHIVDNQREDTDNLGTRWHGALYAVDHGCFIHLHHPDLLNCFWHNLRTVSSFVWCCFKMLTAVVSNTIVINVILFGRNSSTNSLYFLLLSNDKNISFYSSINSFQCNIILFGIRSVLFLHLSLVGNKSLIITDK